MPQITESLTISLTQDEIAAMVREKAAEQFGVAPETIEVVQFRTSAAIRLHRSVEINENDIEVNVAKFIVTITKPTVVEEDQTEGLIPSQPADA